MVAFLFKYWKLIVIGILIISVLGYIKVLKVERDHYKTAAEYNKAQYETLVAKQDARLAQAEANVKEQDAARQAQTIAASKIIDQEHNLRVEELKKHAQELASCHLSMESIRLLNGSGVSRGPDKESAAGNTDKGNVGGTPKVAGGEAGTLEDVAAAAAINHKNFDSMREIIIQWQKKNEQDQRNLNPASESQGSHRLSAPLVGAD